MAMIDAKKVKEAARGQWHTVFAYLCPEWGDAVSKFVPHSRKTPPRGECPVHGGKSGEAFGLLKDGAETGGTVCNSCGVNTDGFNSLMWAKNWTFREALEGVVEALGLQERGVAAPIAVQHTQDVSDDPVVIEKLKAKLNAMWDEAYALDHARAEPARNYFKKRGLLAHLRRLGGEIRLHPALEYWQKQGKGSNAKMKMIGRYPTIVSTVRNGAGVPVNIHRTYITTEGNKAPIFSERVDQQTGEVIQEHNIKKMCERIPGSPVNGGGIKICPAGPVMGVAEGLETTLAAMIGTGMPMECLVNTTLLKSWHFPVGLRTLFIWEDKDASGAGKEAADVLEERALEVGIKVIRMVPPIPLVGKSVDWADVLNQLGKMGFPPYAQQWESLI